MTQQTIPAHALTPHSLSHADPNGRLFHWEGALYRGIPTASAAFYNRLFDEGILPDLVAKGLVVPTERTAFVTADYPLVLKHATVPFVSYPFEWSGEMLKDAALLTLRLTQELAVHGLTLKDAHGWNILFEGTRPVFVDIGSIIEASSASGNLEQEFTEQFLYPLGFLAARQSRIARRLMTDFERGIEDEEYALIGGFSFSRLKRRWLKMAKESARRRLPASWVSALKGRYRGLKQQPVVQSYRAFGAEALLRRVEALQLPQDTTKWSGYYDDEFPPLDREQDWTPKHLTVQRILKEHRPASVLDVGANRGWYSMLAARSGARVVAFDTDEVCLNQLHLDARAAGLDVQSLAMSFCQPSPRMGAGAGMLQSAHERLQCDLVLGLAIAHHLVFKARLNFAQIAAGFAAYTKRVLVIEFVPADDQHVSKWRPEQYPWYRKEDFRAALQQHFRVVREEASHPSPRILFICER